MNDQEHPRQHRPSKEEVLDHVSIILGEAVQRLLESDPHEATIRAYVPGGLSIKEIEEKIRGIQAAHAREQD